MKILSVALLFTLSILSGCTTADPRTSRSASHDRDVYFIATQNTCFHPLRATVNDVVVDVWLGGDNTGLLAYDQQARLIKLAKCDLNYLVTHKNQLDPEVLKKDHTIERLQKVLTDPEDRRQLQELSNQFAAR